MWSVTYMWQCTHISNGTYQKSFVHMWIMTYIFVEKDMWSVTICGTAHSYKEAHTTSPSLWSYVAPRTYTKRHTPRVLLCEKYRLKFTYVGKTRGVCLFVPWGLVACAFLHHESFVHMWIVTYRHNATCIRGNCPMGWLWIVGSMKL